MPPWTMLDPAERMSAHPGLFAQAARDFTVVQVSGGSPTVPRHGSVGFRIVPGRTTGSRGVFSDTETGLKPARGGEEDGGLGVAAGGSWC